MALALDGRQNVRPGHVANILAVFGQATVCLGSVSIGSLNQTAENQAALV